MLPIETATNPDALTLAEPLRQEMQKIFCPHIDPRTPVEFVIDLGDTAERILAHAESGRADLIGLGVRRGAEITTHFRNTVAPPPGILVRNNLDNCDGFQCRLVPDQDGRTFGGDQAPISELGEAAGNAFARQPDDLGDFLVSQA